MEELAELAKWATGHDADAFTALMQSQMQNMYKTARAILANESDIADIRLGQNQTNPTDQEPAGCSRRAVEGSGG